MTTKRTLGSVVPVVRVPEVSGGVAEALTVATPWQAFVFRRKVGSGAARLAAILAGESPANRGVQSLL